MTDFTHFTHFCENEFNHEQNIEQKDDNYHYKPYGVWLAPNNDWIEWCQSEGFFPSDYKYQYIVESIDTSKILRVETLEDIEDFLKKYTRELFADFKLIDWVKVAKDYTGMYINRNALYMKSFQRRYQPFDMLVSGLDVDSLVVWDVTVLKMKLLKHEESGFYDKEQSE